jgi:hypothetical protein
MPWNEVTVSEARGRFPEDLKLNYDAITNLAERPSISGKPIHPGLTAWAGKWTER